MFCNDISFVVVINALNKVDKTLYWHNKEDEEVELTIETRAYKSRRDYYF